MIPALAPQIAIPLLDHPLNLDIHPEFSSYVGPNCKADGDTVYESYSKKIWKLNVYPSQSGLIQMMWSSSQFKKEYMHFKMHLYI